MRTTLTPADEAPTVSHPQAAAAAGLSVALAVLVAAAALGVLAPLTIGRVADAGQTHLAGFTLPALPERFAVARTAARAVDAPRKSLSGTRLAAASAIAGKAVTAPGVASSPEERAGNALPEAAAPPSARTPSAVTPPATTAPVTQPTVDSEPAPNAKTTPRSTSGASSHASKVHKPKATPPGHAKRTSSTHASGAKAAPKTHDAKRR